MRGNAAKARSAPVVESDEKKGKEDKALQPRLDINANIVVEARTESDTVPSSGVEEAGTAECFYCGSAAKLQCSHCQGIFYCSQVKTEVVLTGSILYLFDKIFMALSAGALSDPPSSRLLLPVHSAAGPGGGPLHRGQQGHPALRGEPAAVLYIPSVLCCRLCCGSCPPCQAPTPPPRPSALPATPPSPPPRTAATHAVCPSAPSTAPPAPHTNRSVGRSTGRLVGPATAGERSRSND